MKKSSFIKFGVLLFCMAVTIATHAETQLPMKVCALNSNFGPFTNRNGKGLWQKKIEKITSKISVSVSYYYAPRLRCLSDVKEGVVDAIFAAVTKEREGFLTYPRDHKGEIDPERAVGTIRYQLYKLKDSKVDWDGNKILNTNGESIGIQRGVQSNDLVKLAANQRTNSVETAEQVLSMLRLGRHAAAVIEESQGNEIVKRLKYDNVITAKRIFYESKVYLAFSPEYYRKNQKLINQIWNKF